MWTHLRYGEATSVSDHPGMSPSDSGLTAIPQWGILATPQHHPICRGLSGISPQLFNSGARCLDFHAFKFFAMALVPQMAVWEADVPENFS